MNFKRVAILFACITFLLYFSLILSLFYFFNAPLFIETLFSERTLYSVRLSLMAASISTLFAAVVGIPTAYALSRYEFRGKTLVDTLLELPMIVSPAAMGAMLLIFFSTPPGRAIQENGVQFIFTFYGIIAAQFLTITGVSVRLMKAALDDIPKRFEDVARSLGASHFRAFFSITLPLSRNGLIASLILTWAKAMGEFGATITVAGSMALKTETIPIAIYMRLSSADIEETVVLIFILLTIGLGILYCVRFLTRRSFHA
ncbi:MAG: ABC transporter permease [Nitrospinota bacterium]